MDAVDLGVADQRSDLGLLPGWIADDQLACLAGDATEGVGHEGVQDGHGSLGDSGVRVDLLENAVDVDVVGFFSSSTHLESLFSCVLETVVEWLMNI